MRYIIFSLLLLLSSDLAAQQSSKSKSKDRYREKDVGSTQVRLTNTRDINREGADYAPTFYKNGLVFVSNRPPVGRRDTKSGEDVAELYYAFFDANGVPSFPQKVAFNVEKKPNANDGPLCFSRDNKTVFLTLSNTGKTGKTMLKICESRYGQPNWTKPEPLPFNNDEYSCMHPGLSADGTKLFFASDMPGGMGGYDIYVVERTASGWGKPVNLGPAVNSEKQEIFPFTGQSGTLFFSSNGRANSLGGFDNYFVANPMNDPEEVVNLGEAFNSSADDMSFIVSDDGKTGFFTSTRPGGSGNVDIYRFDAAGLSGIGKPLSSLVPIVVSDAKTGRPLQKAEIRIRPATDNGVVSGSNDVYTTDLQPLQDKPNVLRLDLICKLGLPDYFSNTEGKAQVEMTRYQHYRIVVSLAGYLPKELLVTIDTEQAATIQFRLSVSNNEPEAPSPTETNAEANFSLTHNLQVGTTIILDEVFPESNNVTIYKSTEIYLDALFDLLQQYPEMEIDLVAHTDTRGDARLNQELTEARAKNAGNYLLSRGVAANRITAFGKGETEPLNRCKEGVPCSDAEHGQNNRVEVKVRQL